MKWLIRGLTVLLLCVGTLGLVGCQPDNDTEATRLGKSLGDPGKPSEKGLSEAPEPPPKTQQEFAERQKKRQEEMYKKGAYPGAK